MSYLSNYADFTKLSNVTNIEYFIIFLALLIVIIASYVLSANRNDFITMGFPSLRLGYLDILGHMKYFPKVASPNGLSSNVYILQVMSGFATLFRNKKMFSFWLSYKPFLVLTKAEAVEEMLSTTTTLEKAWSYNVLHPWLGTGLLTSKGQKWKSRRKLLTPSFHFDILKEFLPVFNEQSNVLVQILKEESLKEWTDIVHVITLCSLDIICETTLGVSIGAQRNSNSEYVQSVLRASAATMDRMMNPLQWIDILYYNTFIGRQFKKDLNVLHNFTRNVIQQKKAILLAAKEEVVESEKKRKAFMDLLLDHHVNNKDLNEEDVREEVDTFAFEGHDTTSMGISWTLYLIGLHPEVQKKVHEELDMLFHGNDYDITIDDLKEMRYLERVIKESQRLYPSVPLFGRQANKNTKIEGRKIPEGTVCMVFAYVIHRDPDIFPNPEVFDPERFNPESVVGRHPYAFIPFSAGPRNCIGQRFAMMEMKTVIATVLRQFTITSLEHRDKIQPTPDLILRSFNPIKVKLSPRKL